jgi:hypothetical protein
MRTYTVYVINLCTVKRRYRKRKIRPLGAGWDIADAIWGKSKKCQNGVKNTWKTVGSIAGTTIGVACVIEKISTLNM